MPRLLTKLPLEVQLTIAQFFAETGDQRTLRSWSKVCRFYRSFLAKSIFKSIVLSNDEKNAASVLAIASGNNKGHVQEIRYIAIASYAEHGFSNSNPWDYTYGEDGEEPLNADCAFPSNLHVILSNLSQFPHLQALTVIFLIGTREISLEVYEKTPLAYNQHEKAGVHEKKVVDTSGHTQDMGTLMNKTFTALAENRDHSIRSLNIRNLPPLDIYTYRNPAFHTFLKPLESFSLSLWNQWFADDLEHFRYRQAEAWDNQEPEGLEAQLGSIFFQHLKKVRNLKIICDETEPVGLFPLWMASVLGLDVLCTNAPILRSIHLGQVLLGKEALTFFPRHTPTLEEITLEYCICDSSLTWEQLLESITNAGPAVLSSLTILPLSPLQQSHNCRPRIYDVSIEEELRACTNPWKMMFPYARLEDDVGYYFLSLDGDAIRDSFKDQVDQMEFNRLRAIVEANVRNSESRNRSQEPVREEGCADMLEAKFGRRLGL